MILFNRKLYNYIFIVKMQSMNRLIKKNSAWNLRRWKKEAFLLPKNHEKHILCFDNVVKLYNKMWDQKLYNIAWPIFANI